MQRRKETRKPPEFSDRSVSRKFPPSKAFARMPMEETLMGRFSRFAAKVGKACKRAVHGMRSEEPRKTPVPLEVMAKMYSQSGVVAAKKEAA